jgi:thioredoxin 1
MKSLTISGQTDRCQAEHRPEPGHRAKIRYPWHPDPLLFKNGEVAATKVGALSKGQLKEFLDANLA